MMDESPMYETERDAKNGALAVVAVGKANWEKWYSFREGHTYGAEGEHDQPQNEQGR